MQPAWTRRFRRTGVCSPLNRPGLVHPGRPVSATRKVPVEQERKFSFSLEVPQYNRLRDTRHGLPRILVVLYLPRNPDEWLRHSEEALIARRCAYWVCLRGEPASQNEKYQTVYVPRKQVLSVESLLALMACCSREEEITNAP
jgi:hypothetical protein